MIRRNERLPHGAPVASAVTVRRRKSVPVVRHYADPTGSAVPALLAAVLGFFVITLDAVVVNVALPSTRHDLGGGMTGLLLNNVPGRLAGTASGVFNTSRQIGGALAVAVFGALLANQATFLQGVRISLLIAAGVAVVAAGAALLLRRVPHSTSE